VDVFEFVGNPLVDKIYGSYHWGGKCGGDKEPLPGRGYRPQSAPHDWQTGFHVYSVEWSPTALSFFVDGQKYLTRKADEIGGGPSAAHYLILNQAVSQTFPPGATNPHYEGGGVALRCEWARVFAAAAA